MGFFPLSTPIKKFDSWPVTGSQVMRAELMDSSGITSSEWWMGFSVFFLPHLGCRHRRNSMETLRIPAGLALFCFYKRNSYMLNFCCCHDFIFHSQRLPWPCTRPKMPKNAFVQNYLTNHENTLKLLHRATIITKDHISGYFSSISMAIQLFAAADYKMEICPGL